MDRGCGAVGGRARPDRSPLDLYFDERPPLAGKAASDPGRVTRPWWAARRARTCSAMVRRWWTEKTNG